MERITTPRGIIDRKAALGKLDDILGWSGFSADTQRDIFAIYRDALEAGRLEIKRRFEAEEQSGPQTVHAGAYLIDQVVRLVYYVATEHAYPIGVETKGDKMSMLATGGYGRAELAPSFRHRFDVSAALQAHAPRPSNWLSIMLYTLWDLGLEGRPRDPV